MITGVYIRGVLNRGRGFESVDIGNPGLRADQLLEWLAGLDNADVLKTLAIVRAHLQEDMPTSLQPGVRAPRRP